MDTLSHRTAITRFRALHESGCFVLPNPWDAGSAFALQQLGFQALATTSAGAAWASSYQDGRMPKDAMLEHIRQIVQATSLPVNADFLGGFSDDPDGVARNVALCVSTGVAGLSIEDSTGNPAAPLYEAELAIDRIRAARASIDASGLPVLLTGRCEAWLVGAPRPFETALERLVAYAEAGAECLHAPGVRQPDQIAAIVRAVAPRAVNVLVSAPGPDFTLPRLTELGVRRISVGGALARVAWGAFLQAARGIATTGTFEGLAGVSYGEINGLFASRT